MIKIVKTKNESTEEAVAYLKYNGHGYGEAVRIPNTDLYLCIPRLSKPVEFMDVETILEETFTASVVKAEGKSTEEIVSFLRHNGYGKVVKIPETDLYLCSGISLTPTKLAGIEIVLEKQF